jgi:type II secretory pathway pseudopilin PulG
MSRELLSSEKGFTYFAALFIIMIMGIMLGMIGETWSMIMRRDREEELLFRGKQIKSGIDRYQKAGQLQPGGLKGLDILYKGDDRLPGNPPRYLRKNWNDPITGKEWQLIKDPTKGITGVVSSSEQEPLKQANFPEEFKEFEGKKKYKEWQFVDKPPQPVGQVTRPTVSGLPGSGATEGGSLGGGSVGGGTTGGGSTGGGSVGGMSSGQAGGLQ